MTLKEYVSQYALSHDIGKGTAEQLGFAVTALDKWHGSPVAVGALTDDLINRWLTARIAAGKSRRTVRSQRSAILTLWRSALGDGLVAVGPVRVKTIKAPLPLPTAWLEHQLRALLLAAENAPGTFTCGIKRAAFLRAWLLTAYYTGFRACDLRRLTWEDIGDDGSVCILQQKTGWPILRHLPPDAMAALAVIDCGGAAVFPLNKKTLEDWWNWLKKAAGVPGSIKWLRRTCATHCEVQQPGSAMMALGHRTPGLAYKHYVDPRQVMAKPVTPPRIA